jgi:hypothetical protein
MLRRRRPIRVNHRRLPAQCANDRASRQRRRTSSLAGADWSSPTRGEGCAAQGRGKLGHQITRGRSNRQEAAHLSRLLTCDRRSGRVPNGRMPGKTVSVVASSGRCATQTTASCVKNDPATMWNSARVRDGTKSLSSWGTVRHVNGFRDGNAFRARPSFQKASLSRPSIATRTRPPRILVLKSPLWPS